MNKLILTILAFGLLFSVSAENFFSNLVYTILPPITESDSARYEIKAIGGASYIELFHNGKKWLDSRPAYGVTGGITYQCVIRKDGKDYVYKAVSFIGLLTENKDLKLGVTLDFLKGWIAVGPCMNTGYVERWQDRFTVLVTMRKDFF
jgi:hypothetical protein